MASRLRQSTGPWFGPRAAGVLAVALTASLATVAAVTPAAAGSASGAKTGHTITVGSQTLTECGSKPVSYCGKLAVPLNYSARGGPTIDIAYEWYPAISPPGGVAKGTVVPVEGGPGYPSIESVKGGYQVMYGPLLNDWNMLAVDLRGTGLSSALNCPALQDFAGRASGATFDAVVKACVDQLNHKWKTASGSYVHASDLFTSAPAAADVAAVVRALDIPKIDLYGDSYGSFFAQVFASHYPGLIRSVILDSTYATQQLDPWYRSSIDAMPNDFDLACSRSPACAQAASGPSWSRIEALAQYLRRTPVTGVVPNDRGVMEPFTMDVVSLVDLVNDAAGDPNIYRGLDAAARALLTSGDPAPLLRLYAQRLAFDENYFDRPAQNYSDELYLAVSCLDYPQLFDMNASESVRKAQLKAAEAALPGETFAPFTTQEWLAQNQNTEAYTVCLSWPKPTEAVPPTTGQPLLPASVPVLVLGGEFDTWTPPAGVPQVLGQLGGNSRFVELANSTHVVGEGDTVCGSQLVQAFVEAPQSLQTMNTSCAPAVPAIHTVGVYAESLAGVPPLTPWPTNTASVQLLRLGATAVATAGDALSRYADMLGPLDHGLHGGTEVARDDGRTITLARDVLVPGVAVSGTITSTSKTVSATLTADAHGVATATFKVQWPLGVASATAEVTGRSDGQVIAGATEAP